MNCIVTPVNEQVARNIEAVNLYCQYNRAWLEFYLNWCSYWVPKR